MSDATVPVAAHWIDGAAVPAVAAARGAFPGWAATPPAVRAAYVRRLADASGRAASG